MKLLIDAILDKGKILEGNILKVDTIINHQIDPVLMDQIGEESNYGGIQRDCSCDDVCFEIECSTVILEESTAKYNGKSFNF